MHAAEKSFTQIGGQILCWVRFTDWMHRLSEMPEGEEVIKHAWLSCCVRRIACLDGFILRCTMSFISTPKPFSHWGIENKGRYMLVHVNGQTSLLCYSQMLRAHSWNAALHPQHLQAAHLPKKRQYHITQWLGPLFWGLYGLQMSFSCAIFFYWLAYFCHLKQFCLSLNSSVQIKLKEIMKRVFWIEGIMHVW